MLSVAWLIPLLPFIAFWVILFRGRRLPGEGAYVAIGALGLSGLLSLVILGQVMFGGRYQASMVWATMGDRPLAVGYAVDPLTAVMLFVVTVVGSLIFIYSVGYMHGDPRYPRFFAYLSLFAASMLVLVLANNFLLLYAGWELVGLCSYLLIGFWFERRSAASAAKKAFITNRVGDFGFAIGIVLIFVSVGSLDYAKVFGAAAGLGHGTATAIALLLFAGACGKSAQIPLHVWLPDAMEGPTPVSALIHAATMVTAGVYMVARSNAIFDASSSAGDLVAWIGIATALMAAVILAGWLAIIGFPGTSGFFSKDQILEGAYSNGHTTIWVLLLVATVGTGFYMSRLIFLTFFGRSRLDPGVHPHESPPVMGFPLGVLAALALVGGLLGLSSEGGRIHQWLTGAPRGGGSLTILNH